MTQEWRLTTLGRRRNAPRIDPTYGKAKQRREKRQREAEARQAKHDAAIKAQKEKA